MGVSNPDDVFRQKLNATLATADLLRKQIKATQVAYHKAAGEGDRALAYALNRLDQIDMKEVMDTLKMVRAFTGAKAALDKSGKKGIKP